MIGVEYPKKHDVSIVLEEVSGRFPSWFRDVVAQMARISSKLAGKRSLAMYGDELFGEGNATGATEEAELVFGNVEKLLREWLS